MVDSFCVFPGGLISGDIFLPGDKSISHRAVILSAISNKIVTIVNLCLGQDVLNTIAIMRELGMQIYCENSRCEIHGVGIHGLQSPKNPLNCGNSGTTMRLLTGLLSAQHFHSILIGDASLSKRPMLRVAEPLRLMGAKIHLSENNTAPITITGKQKLKAIDYVLNIPSAQVKSAILLAGLYTADNTIVREITKTRDHTEKMLQFFYSHSRSHFQIPGDISSAAFFIVLAAITKNSDIMIRQVGINPFRTGIIHILKFMGAEITIFNEAFFGLEPVADIRVQYAPLHGIEIPLDLVSKAIDELPVILIAACHAFGKTVLRGAKELRVKESDRIATMVNGLRALGVRIAEFEDGVQIEGPQIFQGGTVDAGDDHRVAMSFAIAGNVALSEIRILNTRNVATSFPAFVETGNKVGMNIFVPPTTDNRQPITD